jgi:hypothetical protein
MPTERAPLGVAIAERVRVPQPHHRAAGVGDLMRRAKLIRRDIKVPRWRKHRDRQIAEPCRLPKRVAEAVVFAGLMARLVIDEEELRNGRIHLRDALVDLALRLSIRVNSVQNLGNAPECRKRSPEKAVDDFNHHVLLFIHDRMGIPKPQCRDNFKARNAVNHTRHKPKHPR